MPAFPAIIDLPEGYEPKYVDDQGHACRKAPGFREEYLSEAHNEILTARSVHSAPRFVVQKIKTHVDEVREWWPKYLRWEWYAVDSTGVAYFYSNEPVVGGDDRWNDKIGLWVLAETMTEHLACGPPPALKGDWKESLVRNPHLENSNG